MFMSNQLRRLIAFGALAVSIATSIETWTEADKCLDAEDAKSPYGDVVYSTSPVVQTPLVSQQSLLQRNVHRTIKVASETSVARPSQCKGISAQEKCWYLSEVGESCAKTCARHGQVFSFAMPEITDPMIPRLLGLEPRIKQEPWAALECYVPKDDRYHTASAKAVQGCTSDMSTWSYKTCQLSCPCHDAGDCKWEQPPACASQFEWNNATYQGCTSVDSDIPWCQHHYHHIGEVADVHEDMTDWSYCTYNCGPDIDEYVKEDHCEWIPPHICVPEFDYEHDHYVGCTASEHPAPWCSLTETYVGLWANCLYSCDDEQEMNRTNYNNASGQDDKICAWQPAAECSSWFMYKGVNYTGCTDEDHLMPWCSHDNVHGRGWSPCARICTEEALTTTSLSSIAPRPISTTTTASKALTTTSLSSIVPLPISTTTTASKAVSFGGEAKEFPPR